MARSSRLDRGVSVRWSAKTHAPATGSKSPCGQHATNSLPVWEDRRAVTGREAIEAMMVTAPDGIDEIVRLNDGKSIGRLSRNARITSSRLSLAGAQISEIAD